MFERSYANSLVGGFLRDIMLSNEVKSLKFSMEQSGDWWDKIHGIKNIHVKIGIGDFGHKAVIP